MMVSATLLPFIGVRTVDIHFLTSLHIPYGSIILKTAKMLSWPHSFSGTKKPKAFYMSSAV